MMFKLTFLQKGRELEILYDMLLGNAERENICNYMLAIN